MTLDPTTALARCLGDQPQSPAGPPTEWPFRGHTSDQLRQNQGRCVLL